MKRNDCLVVLNPRTVAPCMAALDELKIPQIRIVGHTEREIADEAFPTILDTTKHTWLWVVSDDAIVRPYALAAVRSLMGRSPVVTGYSQRSHSDWTVNLTDGPLAADVPSVYAYSFRQYQDVVASKQAMIRTWFSGMSLTGMDIEMWREFPFDCYDTPGYASDFNLSYRLQEAGIPIVAHRDAFCYHFREDWISTDNAFDQSPKFDVKRIDAIT